MERKKCEQKKQRYLPLNAEELERAGKLEEAEGSQENPYVSQSVFHSSVLPQPVPEKAGP